MINDRALHLDVFQAAYNGNRLDVDRLVVDMSTEDLVFLLLAADILKEKVMEQLDANRQDRT